jgi:hypothetical protein
MNAITIEQGTPLTLLLNAQFQHTRGVIEPISLLLSRVVLLPFDNQPNLLQNTLPVQYTGVVIGKFLIAAEFSLNCRRRTLPRQQLAGTLAETPCFWHKNGRGVWQNQWIAAVAAAAVPTAD